MKIKIKKLREDAIAPRFLHDSDAGMDICSVEDVIIPAGGRALVGTGLSMELPTGYAALVWDRSGIATKNGVTKIAGAIDSGYRGEYKIALHNLSKESFEIKKGMRIAQILIQKIEHPEIEVVEDLERAERDANGFGSTGLY